MQKLQSLFLAVIFVAFPAIAQAQADEATHKGAAPRQISSLSQLIAKYDSSSCKECHQEIFEQWSKSHHARPLMGLNNFSFMSKYLRKPPLAVKSPKDAALANFPCAKCHLPQLMEAGDEVARELADVIWRDDKATLKKLNISCLVCHQKMAVVHHKPQADELYGSGGREHEGVFKRVRKSRFLSTPAFCGQCHGLGPNFEFTPPVQCATLYGSYLHAYVADGGSRTCNDCHMKGKSHAFPPNFADKKDAAERYRASLPMDVEILPYSMRPGHDGSRPMIVVRVSISNRAGHRIPDG